MEKRLIFAIALSILVIVSYQYLFVKPATPPEAVKTAEEAARLPVVTKPSVEAPDFKVAPPIRNEKELDVETDKYILTFSNIGGSIKRIRLKGYKEARSDEPLTLVDINDPLTFIFQMSDPTNSVALESSEYELKQDKNAVVYTLSYKDLEVTKKFILHNSKYIIELQILTKNRSPAGRSFSYRIVGGSGLTEPSPQDIRFIEIRSELDGKLSNFKRPKKDRIINPGIVSWVALKNKYFSIILKPFTETKNQFYSETSDGTLVTGIEPKEIMIGPNSLVESRFVLYAGPSDISVLKKTEFGFEGSIDYGFFGWISKALISSMKFFYKIVRNWGISIILLSIFLNLILSPLTLKSFKSMQKMQALHPQMEKLKSQYKDNPQKLNKEIMELYKKYKINPFSGCMPMILQMPIFISLYNALMRSIELRGASFLWVKDLSMPDAVKIPITLPIFGSSINILPIIMIAAMVIQQNMSKKSMGGAVTPEQAQQQRLMLILMPIMFGFIFYNMPSGLVLYWIINTVLTIVEQYAMFKNA